MNGGLLDSMSSAASTSPIIAVQCPSSPTSTKCKKPDDDHCCCLLSIVQWTRLACGIEAVCCTVAFAAILAVVMRGALLNFLPLPLLILNLAGVAFASRGLNKRQPAMLLPYLIWKSLQEIVIVPALVLVTVVDHDAYLRSWSNPGIGSFVLGVVWAYALLSTIFLYLVGSCHRYFWRVRYRESSVLARRTSITSALSIGSMSASSLRRVTSNTSLASQIFELKEQSATA
uniref:Uncharacterized protein n=1 Tax=Plectus sambesii TaxID=2011161 RepID=A0A914VAK7_9BILA